MQPSAVLRIVVERVQELLVDVAAGVDEERRAGAARRAIPLRSLESSYRSRRRSRTSGSSVCRVPAARDRLDVADERGVALRSGSPSVANTTAPCRRDATGPRLRVVDRAGERPSVGVPDVGKCYAIDVVIGCTFAVVSGGDLDGRRRRSRAMCTRRNRRSRDRSTGCRPRFRRDSAAARTCSARSSPSSTSDGQCSPSSPTASSMM